MAEIVVLELLDFISKKITEIHDRGTGEFTPYEKGVLQGLFLVRDEIAASRARVEIIRKQQEAVSTAQPTNCSLKPDRPICPECGGEMDYACLCPNCNIV